MAKTKPVAEHRHPDADFPYVISDSGKGSLRVTDTRANQITLIPRIEDPIEAAKFLELLGGVYGTADMSAPVIEKSMAETLGIVYSLWFILLAIKAKQERTGEALYSVAEMFSIDGDWQVPNLAKEHFHGFVTHLMVACYLGVLSESKLIISVPRTTALWFSKYSATFNAMNAEEKKAAAQELFGDRLVIRVE